MRREKRKRQEAENEAREVARARKRPRTQNGLMLRKPAQGGRLKDLIKLGAKAMDRIAGDRKAWVHGQGNAEHRTRKRKR